MRNCYAWSEFYSDFNAVCFVGTMVWLGRNNLKLRTSYANSNHLFLSSNKGDIWRTNIFISGIVVTAFKIAFDVFIQTISLAFQQKRPRLNRMKTRFKRKGYIHVNKRKWMILMVVTIASAYGRVGWKIRPERPRVMRTQRGRPCLARKRSRYEGSKAGIKNKSTNVLAQSRKSMIGAFVCFWDVWL